MCFHSDLFWGPSPVIFPSFNFTGPESNCCLALGIYLFIYFHWKIKPYFWKNFGIKNALIATLTNSVDWKWNIPICPCLPCARPVLSSFVFAAFIPRNRTRAGRQLTACCMPLASSANKQTNASAFSNQTKKCRVGKKQTADQHLAI